MMEEQIILPSSSTTVAAYQSTEDVLQIGANSDARLCVLIRRVNNDKIAIRALIDTGSPVNLIKKSVYEKLYDNRELLRVKRENSYKEINESPITMYGKIHDQIILEKILVDAQ